MKYTLILLLITVNCFADVRVEITNIHGRSFGSTFETQIETNEWISKRIANDSWGKKERWEIYESQITCLVIEDITVEVPDVSIPYPDPVVIDDVLDEFGNPTYEPYTHPTVMIIDHQRCRMPVEYTITQTDITAEVQAKKDKKNADDLSIEAIKVKLLDGSYKLEDIVNYIIIKEGI